MEQSYETDSLQNNPVHLTLGIASRKWAQPIVLKQSSNKSLLLDGQIFKFLKAKTESFFLSLKLQPVLPGVSWLNQSFVLQPMYLAKANEDITQSTLEIIMVGFFFNLGASMGGISPSPLQNFKADSGYEEGFSSDKCQGIKPRDKILLIYTIVQTKILYSLYYYLVVRKHILDTHFVIYMFTTAANQVLFNRLILSLVKSQQIARPNWFWLILECWAEFRSG